MSDCYCRRKTVNSWATVKYVGTEGAAVHKVTDKRSFLKSWQQLFLCITIKLVYFRVEECPKMGSKA